MPATRPLLRGLFVLTLLGAGAIAGRAGDAKKTAVDAEGDALPDGATTRFGSQRWRHGEAITFVAAPPDGKTLITAGSDAVLRLWDRDTGKELRRFDANGKGEVRFTNYYMQGLTRAALSKDGKLLAVALPSNVVQLWEVETGKALRQVKSPVNGVATLTFSPDGKMLVMRGINDRVALVYESDSGKEIRKLKPEAPGGKQGNIFGGAGDGTAIAFSADSKTIALSELEFDGMRVSGSVTLFESDSGKQIRRIESQTNGIGSIAFAPDGKTLVFNTHNNLCVHNAETGKQVRQFNSANGANVMMFLSDGKTIAVKGRDQLVRLYDVTNGTLVRTIGERPGPKGVNNAIFVNSNGSVVTDMALLDDGKSLVLGGQNLPRFFDVATGAEKVLTGGGHRGAVTALGMSAEGKTLVSRGTEGVLRVWDAATGKETRQIPEPAGTSAVRFTPDGKLAALANNDGSVRLIDVADGKERQFKAHAGTIASIAFTPDGTRLATRGAYDGLIRIFDVAKGVELKQIMFHDMKAGNGQMIIRTVAGQRDGHPLAFSADGKLIATYVSPQLIYVPGQRQVHPDSNSLRFYDAATGKETRRMALPEGRTIQQLTFSLDGRLLISENSDKTVSLWEIASGKERIRFGEVVTASGQTTSTSFVAVNGVVRNGPAMAPAGVTIAMSRDGSLIAAPGAGNTIKVYDATLGKEIGALRGHDGAIASLEFTADAKTLVSGSNDSTLLAWDLTRLKRAPRPHVAELSKKEFDRLWADLVHGDAGKAGQSIQTLIAAADLSVAQLKERIQPVEPADAKKVEQWIRDLDSTNFKNRASAARDLEKLGELAVPALQKALASNPSLEKRRRLEPMLDELLGTVLTPDQIRAVRAIEVLDKIGSAEARRLLETLAGGARAR